MDTIEGVRVALKIPHPHLVTEELLDSFRHEARMAARLDHGNVLTLKNATFLDGYFVIAFPLAEKTLADRLQKRISVHKALDYAEQMLDAVAYAHQHRVIHCDIKPENFLIFPDDRIRLADFGIAKVARRTIQGSGSGTMGYMAPEQAMGKPSFRSDVFALGLVLYRMFAGVLPDWPYDWPPPGLQQLRRKVPQDFIQLLRRALEVSPRKRYRDAVQMRDAFLKIKPKVLRKLRARRHR